MKKYVLAGIMSAMLIAPAYANDKDMSAKVDHWFNKIDSDSDGMITKEEHTAFGDSMFMEADANKDGKISKSEMTAQKKKEHDEMKSAK